MEKEIRMLHESYGIDDVRKRNMPGEAESTKINSIEYDALWPYKIGDVVYRLHPLHPGFNCVKHMGWLYYVNQERKDFLYRVREDGTENQQITNFSVNRYCVRHVRLEDGYLCFSDGQREIFVQE